jgi:SPP1 gp7 family putative phage head morphogenesis protein
MSWAVSAEQSEFSEALDWFRSRVPYTQAQLDTLDDKARARAFAIAGHLELESVQTIFDELDHSIAKGTPFEDFQKRVEEKLLGKVGPDGFHLETVFRNWTQTAYNTGRWYQLTDPELSVLRPFLCFDALLDDRVTEVCKNLDGTIKPVGDPFWLTHAPICHHRCRSSLRSLRTSQAERAGISTTDPMVEIPEGFGLAPPMRGDDIPGPDQRRFDPEVWDAFTKRQADTLTQLEAANDNARRLRDERDRQDPAFWKPDLAAKYGEEAGGAIAWGRAMEYRGRALTLEEASLAHRELVEVGGKVTTNAESVFVRARTIEHEAAQKAETLGALIDAVEDTGEHALLASELKATSTLIGHARSVESANLKLPIPRLGKTWSTESKARVTADHKQVAKWLGALTDASVTLPDVNVKASHKRARYAHRLGTGKGTIEVNGRAFGGDLAHEWGHALENFDPRAKSAVTSFLAARTVNDAPQYLRDLTGIPYSRAEIAKPDHFLNPYMGKLYRHGATEITSMGLDLLRMQRGAELYSHDPEHFWLTLGILAGGKVP